MTLELTSPPETPPVKRRRAHEEARFLPDVSGQLDPMRGAPALQVPDGHLAWTVKQWVEEWLDCGELTKSYSSLGRRGHHPSRLLAVWIYAVLDKKKYATNVSNALKTDAAYIMLAGGRWISASVLRTFRRENGVFFDKAIQQTIARAVNEKLLDLDDLSVDSARLRAHASSKSMRTLKRSKARLQELSKIDVAQLDEEARKQHDAKVSKHQEAVESCAEQERTSYSTTNETAALIKFPDGGAAPGHRVTVVSVGQKLRFIVGMLLNWMAHDGGLLGPALLEARRQLLRAGLAENTKFQVAADAGYLSEKDLGFADANKDWLDVLINVPASDVDPNGYFGRDVFVILPDGSARCPANRPMSGPYKEGDGRYWRGQGCVKCELRSKCTRGSQRKLRQSPRYEALVAGMKERLEQPGARTRYNRRIATVEPVFAYLEDNMGYRRASSRHTATIKAELLLHVLAYNLSRLRAGRPVFLCLFCAELDRDQDERLVIRLPRWELLDRWGCGPVCYEAGS